MEVVVQEEHSSTGMGDLPESCIASILRLTTPRNVARLAGVSRVFRDASHSDSVWQTMLPPFYEDILAQAADAPARSCSRKEIYEFLTTPVLLENGTQDFWLDRATGGVCRSMGARGLYMVWGEDPRYWSWIQQEGSRFAEVAYLTQVWWLQVEGNMHCSLLPGTYTVSWRLSFAHDDVNGFDDPPVKFSVEGPDHVLINVYKDLANHWSSNFGDSKWAELDVGEFTVGRGVSPVAIKFSLKEIDCGYLKSGMFVDSVLIQPTAVKKISID
ncbi:unnamed protein product [Calypogeia fissa]